MTKRKERIFILLIDFIAINAAWIVHYWIRIESGIIPYTLRPDFLIPMLVVCAYWYIIFLFFGLYRAWYAQSRVDELLTIVKAITVGTLILFFIIFLDDEARGDVEVSSRLLIFGYWFAMVLFVGLGRMVVRTIQHRLLEAGVGHRKTVIVGDVGRSLKLLELVRSHPALGYYVVGLITPKSSDLSEDQLKVPYLGSPARLSSILKKHEIEEVLIAFDGKNRNKIVDVINICNGIPVGLKILPDLYSIVSGQVRTNQIYGVPLVEVMPRIIQPWEESAKRVLDFTVSLCILSVGLPLWLIVVLAIKIESSGPVLYKQERVGKNGKNFKIFKFRSMYRDAEKLTGPKWALKKDPRVTKVGAVIRKLHIDEIPQFINVLNGSMSLIGPRPERPFFVEQFNQQIPLYSRRHAVRPGISGWAQVKHKYDESIEDVKLKLQYDLYYIENLSLTMDLKILLMTVYRVFLGKGH